MSKRFWIYSSLTLIIITAATFSAQATRNIERQKIVAINNSNEEQEQRLSAYVTKQTDPVKLIRLAKVTNPNNTNLIGIIADRAYALSPNNRDILVLDSQFHPELKSKITQIDPLYKNN